MNNKKIELLAPAGDMDAFRAAVNAGADAIYIGGKLYSARASANNFDVTEIERAVDYATPRGVKTFVTVNTLYKEVELAGVLNFINELYKMGVSAVIVQDMGLAMNVKKYFPDMELHASTQMTIHDLEGARFVESIGFDRVVLSRETNLDEIKDIKEKTNIKIETFVHGALCLSYSGQCLMSSFIGGRSGNRGRCAQPCRKQYELLCNDKCVQSKDKYLLSLKDISTIDIIPELIEAGIDSFKIEGRMKKPEYVAGVVSIYRKYLDSAQCTVHKAQLEKYKVDEKDKRILAQLFNRGKFSEGYYNTSKSLNMMSMTIPKNQGVEVGKVISTRPCQLDKRSNNQKFKLDKGFMTKIKAIESLNPGDGIQILNENGVELGKLINKNIEVGDTFEVVLDDVADIGATVYRNYDKKLEDSLKVYYQKDSKKQNINMEAELKAGIPMKIIVGNIEVIGESVEHAQNLPLSKDRVIEQLRKVGNTPFEIEDIAINMDDDAYINISKINEIRRNALDILEKEFIKNSKRNRVNIYFNSENKKSRDELIDKRLVVLANTEEQAKAAIDMNADRLYLEYVQFNLSQVEHIVQAAQKKGTKVYIALPYILRKRNYKKFDKEILELEQSEIDGYLIRTYGEYEKIINSKKEKVLDYTFNIYNNESISFWRGKGVENITISPELNVSEISELQGEKEAIIYGKIPVMFIEQCIIKNMMGYKVCQDKSKAYKVRDDKGEEFEVANQCDMCLNVLYNNNKLHMLNDYGRIENIGLKYFRLNLFDETYEESADILKAYKKAMDGYGVVDNQVKIKKYKYTKGHYFRGVE